VAEIFDIEVRGCEGILCFLEWFRGFGGQVPKTLWMASFGATAHDVSGAMNSVTTTPPPVSTG
jgi:hypothetical protein